MQPNETPQPPQIDPVPQPSVVPAAPAAVTVPPQNDYATKGFKNAKRAGVAGIVIGGLGTLVAVFGGLFYSAGLLINTPLFVATLIFAVFLVRSKELPVVLKWSRVLLIIVLVEVILSLIAGGGSGVLDLLVVLFVILSTTNFYKAGLITSSSPVLAKIK